MLYIIHENLWWWGKSYVFVTADGKALVTLSIEDERTDCGFVHSLMVLESERQKGIGTQLLKTVESKARQIGLQQIYLEARKGTFVIDWYRRLGFEIYDENPKESKGNTVMMNKVFTEENRLE